MLDTLTRKLIVLENVTQQIPFPKFYGIIGDIYDCCDQHN